MSRIYAYNYENNLFNYNDVGDEKWITLELIVPKLNWKVCFDK